ncbi:MAG: glycosyltransferase family 1 protein, partial [Pseudobutyrivibrio sp.]|nr:glycosyltransferase family 1 protein [Pseudobutyrivibrio sp.]
YSNEDLYEKATYYLKHDSERTRIAAAGREYVANQCSYERRLEEIIKKASPF